MNLNITLNAPQDVVAEVSRLRRVNIAFADIISNHCIAMQAAVIEACVNDSDKGMAWIRNTLAGPGLLPDVDQAIELSEAAPAQAWFDAETSKHEAFRAQHPQPESPKWPAGMPPASWDVYAMHEGMRLASSGSQASFSQRVNQLHAALTEAMWFAAPGGEPSYATEPTVDLPKIGAVPASLANTPGIQALVRWANSGTVIDKQVCWDTIAMFDARDALVAALAKTGPAALPDIEAVSAAVHAAWMDSKRAQGVESRKAEDGEELMVPYSDLSERAKDLDRCTVRAVYQAIESLGSVEKQIGGAK